MKLCPFCNKEITKKRNKFCNRSCATSYNNKNRPKKFKWNNCKKCNSFLNRKDHNDRRKLCDDCNPSVIDWSTITYGVMKKQRTL